MHSQQEKEASRVGLSLLNNNTFTREDIVRLLKGCQSNSPPCTEMSASALCYQIKEGVLKGYSHLHGLTLWPEGIELLALFFDANPELPRYISGQILCTPLRRSLANNKDDFYLPLHGLTLSALGVSLLQCILSANPDAVPAINAQALSMSLSWGYSPLHGLMRTPASLRLLTEMRDNNREMMSNLAAEAWCKTLQMGNFTGMSPLAFLLSASGNTPYIELIPPTAGLLDDMATMLLTPQPSQISPLCGLAYSLQGKKLILDCLIAHPEMTNNITDTVLLQNISSGLLAGQSLRTLLKNTQEGEGGMQSETGMAILKKLERNPTADFVFFRHIVQNTLKAQNRSYQPPSSGLY